MTRSDMWGAKTFGQMPWRAMQVMLACIAIGVVTFVLGLLLSYERTWQIYHVNLLFWTGMAQGGVAMAAVYRLTNAQWGDQFRRAGEVMVGFLPVSILLFVFLAFSGGSLFPWMSQQFAGREFWLNPIVVFLRDGALLLILTLFSLRYVYYSVRPELGLLRERQRSTEHLYLLRLTAGWRGWEEERESADRRLAWMTPLFLLVFVTVYTLLGFDLVMSMDPRWYSTIYGWMFTLHAFYAALTAVVLLAFASERWLGWKEAILPGQWHDMGRFLFGFALLSGGFFWSQFLVLWYGNIPEETTYLKIRFYERPWEPLMWVYIIGAYLFPLFAFLSARLKRIPAALAGISLLLMAALFLERFIAVVPFVWHESWIPFSFLEVGVTLGFLGLFIFSWIWFAALVSPVSFPLERAQPSHEALVRH